MVVLFRKVVLYSTIQKNSLRNVQFNSQTNTQWYCLISSVPQMVFEDVLLLAVILATNENNI